jgi:hypothetical protein
MDRLARQQKGRVSAEYPVPLLAELRTVRGGIYAHAGKRRYPASRNECDLALGELPDWAIEVKMARLRRDNGGYENTTTKKILSPCPDDRRTVTDCRKLASSGFGERPPLPGSTSSLSRAHPSLIPSLIRLRPDPFGSHHARRRAHVRDAPGLRRTLARSLGKRVGGNASRVRISHPPLAPARLVRLSRRRRCLAGWP